MTKGKTMSDISNRKHHYKTIKKTCYTANILYLIVHIFYLVLFIINRFDVLIYVTAGTVLAYILFFFLLKKKKYYPYALCCGNLFLVYVSVTTVKLGFNTGFHFYLIGLCVVSFFTTYFSKDHRTKGSIIWAGMSLIIYLVLYFVTRFNTPFYIAPEWLEITLFTVHAAAVFVFIVAYLRVFIKYALSLENKIMDQSRTDELTQINNRYGLYDYFEQEDKSSTALALFDIDDFKGINDKYGHVTGDYILKRVAEITSNVLSDAFVCRYGGEEFVIVLNEDKEHSLFERLDALRENIEKETFEFEGLKINITITIGVENYSNDLSIEEWIKLADEKMYSGKKSGKNKTVI